MCLGLSLLFAVSTSVLPAMAQHHAPIVRMPPRPVAPQPRNAPAHPAQQGAPQRPTPYASQPSGALAGGSRSLGDSAQGYPNRTDGSQGYGRPPYADASHGYPNQNGSENPSAVQPGYAQGRSAVTPAGSAETQNSPNRPRSMQGHLGPWLDSHRNLPLEQQQHALEQEPGFRQLAPDQQQRVRDRLTQLNRMSPQQRQNAIDRTEAMERLTPQQRQQVRSAAGELGSLPPDRRRAVAQAFRGLQSLPPEQRQGYLNSPQVRGQFNDQERGTLNSLMQASPYLPLRRPPPPQQ